MSNPIDMRSHLIAKKIEDEIASRIKEKGYQYYVRKFLHHYFNTPYSRESTEALAWGLGILVRQGFIRASFAQDLFEHLGVNYEDTPPAGSKNDG